MQLFFKERQYKFKNGCELLAYPIDGHKSVVTLYDPAGNIVVSTQSLSVVNHRMEIVNHIKRLAKIDLDIQSEYIIYGITDAVIDEESMNLDAVITPHRQQSHSIIWIRLFKYLPVADYDNCLWAYKTRTSYTAPKAVEKAITEAVKNFSQEVHNEKVCKLHNTSRLIKRILYFNNGRLKVEVYNLSDIANLNIYENFIGYDAATNEVIFREKVLNINLYERKEILKKVSSVCLKYGINIQKMDKEECEYQHGVWGNFIVAPIGNNGLKIYSAGVFNIQKNVNIKYDDYEGIIHTVNELAEIIEKDPMKHKRKQIKETDNKNLFDIFKR